MRYFLFLAASLFANTTVNASELTERDKWCLAMNIYHEARGESVGGMLAVAMVTFNRLESKRYPNDICRVVYQGKRDKQSGKLILNRCQFSWACDRISDQPKDRKTWEMIRYHVVETAYHLRKLNIDMTQGATHYHAADVNPYWAEEDKMIAQIDTHKFYVGIR